MAKNKGLIFYKRKKKISSAFIREIFSWMFGIFTAVFIAIVLNLFLGMSTRVVGASMEPGLYNGQQVFINRFVYLLTTPKIGDVVVFLPNGNENAHYYVKRVVALPGDSVEIQGGVLYVNDEESEWMKGRLADAGIAASRFVLGNDEYFCIGDDPDNSEDSRSANIGPVNETDIIGKVWFCAPCAERGMGFVR